MEEIKIGDRCPQCGAKAEKRVCSVCGIEKVEIDCGHFAQPLFITAGHYDGSESDKDFCEDCECDYD